MIKLITGKDNHYLNTVNGLIGKFVSAFFPVTNSMHEHLIAQDATLSKSLSFKCGLIHSVLFLFASFSNQSSNCTIIKQLK